jgi:hypothetical protein
MKRIIIILAVILSITSCKKFLDEKPTNLLLTDGAIQNTNDLKTVLMGAYDGFQSGNVYGGNYNMFGDLFADDTEVIEEHLSAFGTSEIYNRATTTQIGFLRGAWADGYSTINRANIVIDVVDNNLISDNDFETEKDNLKGQALFLRAITYFQMLHYWSKPYDVDNQGGNSQLGIPYRIVPIFSKDDELDMARNTVEEVYENVINDLKEARLLIKNVRDNNFASQMAATAFLARVYFFKGDYANASIEANNVINSSNFKLTSKDEIIKMYTTSERLDNDTIEIIFQLINTSSDQSNSLSGYYQSNYSSCILHCSDDLRQIFNPLGTQDARRKSFISYNSFTTPPTITVKKWNQTSTTASNIPIIRLAEMHLIRAEANFLSGGSQTDAEASYKAIRERAIGSANYTSEGGTPAWTAEDFLVKIRDERRRELCFEGDRYLNLRRLKLPVRDGVAYDDPSLLFKIPQEEMSGNTLMEQNM